MGSKPPLRLSSPCLMSLALLIAGEASAGYNIVDLGLVTPGSSSVGNAINASGGVAGTTTSGYGVASAVQSRGDGGFSAVSFPIPGVGSSVATGINDGNQVTGSFYDTVDKRTHAYSTNNGVAVDLGTLDYRVTPQVIIKAQQTVSNGISDSGQVVGTVSLADGTSHAFTGLPGGGLSFLPKIGDGQFSQGNGINSGGQMVGSFETNIPGVIHAFTTDANGNPADIMSGHTAPGFGLNTYGMAINNAGFAIGYGDFGQGTSHAFLAPAPPPIGGAKTPLIDLGVLSGYSSSYAYGINAKEQVVGKLEAGGGSSAAFVYDPSRGMIDLHSLLARSDQLLWTSLVLASGINDSLQITGQGILNGQLHAFLLTPIPGQSPFAVPSAVPGPPALALSALGLAIAAGAARLRRGRTGGRGAA